VAQVPNHLIRSMARESVQKCRYSSMHSSHWHYIQTRVNNLTHQPLTPGNEPPHPPPQYLLNTRLGRGPHLSFYLDASKKKQKFLLLLVSRPYSFCFVCLFVSFFLSFPTASISFFLSSILILPYHIRLLCSFPLSVALDSFSFLSHFPFPFSVPSHVSIFTIISSLLILKMAERSVSIKIDSFACYTSRNLLLG
jgi:hypothetical protein